MTAALELTGLRFGRVLVQRRAASRNGKTRWFCLCVCGADFIALGSNLKRGLTRSCGCLNRDRMSEIGSLTTHGMSDSPEYRAWAGMKWRCSNLSNPNYGGAGVTVYPVWQNSFLAFFNYIGPMPYSNMTIDRYPISNGNYEPGNVRWADKFEQAGNKMNNILLEHDGRTQCLAAWARELDVDRGTLWSRINAGWDMHKALTTPINKSKSGARNIEYDGKVQSLTEWANERGLTTACIYGRLKLGWSIEKALFTPKRPWRYIQIGR